jgi:hypothetical protein
VVVDAPAGDSSKQHNGKILRRFSRNLLRPFFSPGEHGMKFIITNIGLTLIVITLVGFAPPVFAGPGDMGGRGPYGGYCEGPRWGWYGARTPVTTGEEARKRLEKFFEGQNVAIGVITEHRMFFKAEVKEREGKIVDQVIIHKRSGRIRSTF